MKIEVCMAVYKRVERLPKLIDQLKNQTYKDFRLNIWNNSGEKLDVDMDAQIIDSPENVGSIGRFLLVPKTKGRCIIFIDDDLDLQPDFIEYMYKAWLDNPDDLQGWFTRIFNGSYWNSIPYNPENTEVDYVGTGGMVLSRDVFDDNPCLLSPPPEMIKVEDLWLSYIAKMNGLKLYALEAHCKIENDGNDQYKDLIEYKEEAFLYLKNLGWETILERR
jgi:hypothetical protein